jgi:hypothetical protein
VCLSVVAWLEQAKVLRQHFLLKLTESLKPTDTPPHVHIHPAVEHCTSTSQSPRPIDKPVLNPLLFLYIQKTAIDLKCLQKNNNNKLQFVSASSLNSRQRPTKKTGMYMQVGKKNARSQQHSAVWISASLFFFFLRIKCKPIVRPATTATAAIICLSPESTGGMQPPPPPLNYMQLLPR